MFNVKEGGAGMPPAEGRGRRLAGFADRSALRALTPLQVPHAGGAAYSNPRLARLLPDQTRLIQ